MMQEKSKKQALIDAIFDEYEDFTEGELSRFTVDQLQFMKEALKILETDDTRSWHPTLRKKEKKTS
jgi:hypothetical protein